MSSQLDDLLKWSEAFTKPAWGNFMQMLKDLQPSAIPTPPKQAGDVLSRLQQLNQLTLASIEQFRYWETVNEQIKNFSEAMLAGLNLKSDSRVQELEGRIDELKTRLNAQEELLKKLQARLKAEENSPPDMENTSKILSDFLTEQTRQFKKLVESKD